MEISRDNILALLRATAEARPGLDPREYGDWRSYRNESAKVTRQLQRARAMLRAVEWRDSITADKLQAALQDAYAGRLSLTERNGRPALSYCTGQYYATEYRAAVGAVCASALWAHWRDNMPAPAGMVECHGFKTEGYPMPGNPRRLVSAGDWLRATARRELGRALADWFYS